MYNVLYYCIVKLQKSVKPNFLASSKFQQYFVQYRYGKVIFAILSPGQTSSTFRIQHATFVGHSIACCWVFAWSNAPNILPRHLLQTRRELQKQKKCIVANILIPIKLPSTTYNMLRPASVCINKVVKRSRLFPLDKCCMLHCEKSSSFDQGFNQVATSMHIASCDRSQNFFHFHCNIRRNYLRKCITI